MNGLGLLFGCSTRGAFLVFRIGLISRGNFFSFDSKKRFKFRMFLAHGSGLFTCREWMNKGYSLNIMYTLIYIIYFICSRSSDRYIDLNLTPKRGLEARTPATTSPSSLCAFSSSRLGIHILGVVALVGMRT